ncbi:MAG TPA: hypothetical protein RMH26_26610, partial [Polyangiaceae bacterium LLY-WYZ-15_(1-7)]|nr:hypothetical protein [Polyangiaceae bacterium LLY-WYZ-15_(1-7)]
RRLPTGGTPFAEEGSVRRRGDSMGLAGSSASARTCSRPVGRGALRSPLLAPPLVGAKSWRDVFPNATLAKHAAHRIEAHLARVGAGG